MEADKELDNNGQDPFFRHKDEINKAYDRAVREALLKHKRAGNPVPVERDGKLVILQPEEIEIS